MEKEEKSVYKVIELNLHQMPSENVNGMETFSYLLCKSEIFI